MCPLLMLYVVPGAVFDLFSSFCPISMLTDHNQSPLSRMSSLPICSPNPPLNTSSGDKDLNYICMGLSFN